MEEEKKKYKEIELRSEEVQEVMEKIPSWITRCGITIISGVVLILIIGSCFFKYPDIVVTEMVLTGRQPVAQLVARNSGKIKELYVSEGRRVEEGELLAILDNSASAKDVFRLKRFLMYNIGNPDSMMALFSIREELALGDVQATYSRFISNIHEYTNFRTLSYYPQKMEQVQKQIKLYGGYYNRQKQQVSVMESQHRIAQQQYARDSLLFTRGLLSASDHEVAVSALLQSQSSLENLRASLENLKIQISTQESMLLDLKLEETEKENVLFQSYCREAESLQNAINDWELTYCLISPINGKVTFSTYWSINQFVPSGEKVFTVVPEEPDELIGRAFLPIQRSGKVKTGQRVIIRFDNYPDNEFGVVYGEVSSISLTPTEGNYMIEIHLPDGLNTNYGISLPISQEMTASAEIVTEELRLIERFIMPMKKVLKERF